ncbi:SDR family oxidoreductase [Sediminibacillus dalangtanensis]|uniref:SDR family oxidoreductase n=1 Tax=Sediminibacillus dalangtanensis TaxID=2729421 RepID=A0ABX7VTZ8_9BACI|nr:SDR family oxidoreductase [Sediminibacillus dalangtanensis]QTM99474.1 SDR family oxidoreductase [Sediminibacillus dalangtanensis]
MKGNCLIIGASGDIGKAIALRVVEEGYQVLLHYNGNKQAVDELASTLPDEAVLAVLHGDLRTNEGITMFLHKLDLPVDALVFASGTSHIGLFQDTEEAIMDVMLTMQVKALWMISRHVIPSMIEKQSGHIVVVSSIWGDIGASCEVVYSSVKGAQNSFVKSLGKELAPSGINVNGISPGFIDTRMNEHFSFEDRQSIVSEIPASRAGNPQDVAHAAAFLLDSRSSYIQGEIINVTGAW